VKAPHASLSKPIADVTEIAPANPLASVQTTDKLRPNNLLNQARGKHSNGEDYDTEKLT
jgi:hypothetical protein